MVERWLCEQLLQQGPLAPFCFIVNATGREVHHLLEL
jgi:hypothetical protein